MNITEIRTKLVNDPAERLRAYCSITIDEDFVIRDLKVIEGPNGLFLAMPSRKLTDRCPKCGSKNHLRARFCNDCGARLPENRIPRDQQGRSKLHADVAHPITSTCRERIQEAVVEAFSEEFERSQTPGYKPADYDEYDEYEDETEPEAVAQEEPEEDDDEDEIESEFFDADGEEDGVEFEPAPRPSGREQQRGPSEYDALIADLRRDATGRGSQRRVGGRDSGGSRESRGGGGRRDGGQRGNERSGDRGARREPPRERTDSRRAAASGASSSSASDQPQKKTEDSSGGTGREGTRDGAQGGREGGREGGRRGGRGGRGGRGRGGRRERNEGSTAVADKPARDNEPFFGFDDEPQKPVAAAEPKADTLPPPPPPVETPKPVEPPQATRPEPVEEEDDFGAGLL